MTALKKEIGILVVESRVVQDSDIRVPANMIGMADFAGTVRDFRPQAVKSHARLQISINLFVAVTAELGLGALTEACVATRTLTLVLSMSLNHCARHQQGLNVSGSNCVHKQ